MPQDPTLNYTRPSPSERRAAFFKAIRRWFRRIFLTLLALAIIALIIDQTWVWYWRRIEIGHDTTRITSPIEPSGCPDYLAALNAQYSAGVTPENNAAPLLLKITGTQQTPAIWQSSIQKLLALGPATLPAQFVTLAESQYAAKGSTTKPTTDEQSAADDEEDLAAASPWSPLAHPQWAAWIKANDHALDLLHVAVARPEYYVPIVSQTGSTARLGNELIIKLHVPPLGSYRELARVAFSRAMMRLDAGDFDGFRQEIVTTVRFARLLSEGRMLIDYLVARAIDEKASLAIQAAANSENINLSQVDSLLRDSGALPPFPPPSVQIDRYERFMCLDAACKLARFDDAHASFIENTRTRPVNFNHCLRLTNSYFDGMLAALAQPTFTQRQRALMDNGRRFDSALAHSGRIERMLLSVILPDLSGPEKLHTAALVNRDLALIALALRAHKLRTRTFPDHLSDLAPLPATTQNSELSTQDFTKDRFTDQPLIYRRQAEGYLLYSLGPNQKDDGGTPRASEGPARKDYDIVVRADK